MTHTCSSVLSALVTRTNRQASSARQLVAATKALLLNSPKKKPGVKGAQNVTTVKEVISGSVPLAKRDKFRSLIEGKHKVLKVFVESARAVARNALVAEEAWQLSKQNGVQIIPADLPFLFKHDASPGETFMRWVMLSVQEFDRDMVVHRLTGTHVVIHGNSRELTESYMGTHGHQMARSVPP